MPVRCEGSWKITETSPKRGAYATAESLAGPKKDYLMKAKAKQDEQYAEFIRAAREIGANEERSAVDDLVGKLEHTLPAPKKARE